ncbi:hypothetical protein ACHHYP_03437 [Achlya hypogyna]|uniref:PPM-type phosphatase domain-containing protein n=1 Tax=Achlya hypogyna TaxID=1202772 RepID=A0A1V9ZR45_ACHHY|nr:hypothetical protein ACHHYP_03437 [Achlya hypogyna]
MAGAALRQELFSLNHPISFAALTFPFASCLPALSPVKMVATPFVNLKVLEAALPALTLRHAMASWKSPSHENEDRALMHRGERFSVFAVMDGHGGDLASEYVKNNLVRVLDEQPELTKSSIAAAVATLETIFNKLASTARDYSGACFVALIVVEDGSARRFVVNVGDCRISALEVSARGHPKRTIHALSNDHKASDPNEKRRILVAGGSVVSGRVAGVLAPSRSIGDIDMKVPGMEGWVIAEPEISEGTLCADSIYVLATDGVWDVLSDDEVLDIAEETLRETDDGEAIDDACQRACDAIAKEAIMRGSRDDITAVVVRTQ